MKKRNKAIAVLIFLTLGSSLGGTSYAQEKGKWRIIYDKDAMTDQVTSFVMLGEKDLGKTGTTGMLSVGKRGGRELIALTLPRKLTLPTP